MRRIVARTVLACVALALTACHDGYYGYYGGFYGPSYDCHSYRYADDCWSGWWWPAFSYGFGHSSSCGGYGHGGHHGGHHHGGHGHGHCH
jgi:hypothetical protein